MATIPCVLVPIDNASFSRSQWFLCSRPPLSSNFVFLVGGCFDLAMALMVVGLLGSLIIVVGSLFLLMVDFWRSFVCVLFRGSI